MHATLDPKVVTPPKPVDSNTVGFGCKTILFNDDVHTFDQVARQSVKAIGCTLERGYEIANEVHNTGAAIVFSGHFERCEHVAMVYEQIGLLTKVER